ncbi:condensation domain-containing protein [Nocardia sp. NPDC049707]|uniref:phthiocerol/phthiodiolone dimycocerosyl transferase family protein n=1 Tax=Nocardia sp. NPDC049707 TaxID=3154735 RepID=UPI0034179DF2
MTAQRALSPLELTYFGTETRLGTVPAAGIPVFIGSTVHGLLDIEILRRVLDELAAQHPLLRSKPVTDADGTRYLRRDDAYRPRLDIADGGEAEYLNLVNGPLDWRDGLFHAHLLRDGDRDRIILVIHHGIADGRSAFALLAQLWQRYTAHTTGTALPPSDSDQELPESIDARLTEVVSDAEVAGWLDQIRAGAATMSPESAPRSLPIDGDGIGDDPLGRFALQRIELDTNETRDLIVAAGAHGLSVNSLLGGAALVAFRSQLEPATGKLPLLCGHAADVRSEVNPPLPANTILNCASGIGTFALVADNADLIDIAHEVAAGMAAAREQREAPIFLLASQRIQDEATAAIFAAAPTVAISNIGRLPAYSTPDGIRHIRDEIYAMGPGMPPKLTVFTVGERLTIQVEYDTARYSRAQMGKVSSAFIDALQGIRAA